MLYEPFINGVNFTITMIAVEKYKHTRNNIDSVIYHSDRRTVTLIEKSFTIVDVTNHCLDQYRVTDV